MKEINEIIKTDEQLYPDSQTIKSDELIGEEFNILGYGMRTTETGDFAILHISHKSVDKSFTCGGKVIINKLQRLSDQMEVKGEDKVYKFPDSVKVKLIKKKTQDGKYKYFDFE